MNKALWNCKITRRWRSLTSSLPLTSFPRFPFRYYHYLWTLCAHVIYNTRNVITTLRRNVSGSTNVRYPAYFRFQFGLDAAGIYKYTILRTTLFYTRIKWIIDRILRVFIQMNSGSTKYREWAAQLKSIAFFPFVVVMPGDLGTISYNNRECWVKKKKINK